MTPEPSAGEKCRARQILVKIPQVGSYASVLGKTRTETNPEYDYSKRMTNGKRTCPA